MLHIFVKYVTSSCRTSPCGVIGLLFFMILILSLFTFSPNVAIVIYIRDVASGTEGMYGGGSRLRRHVVKLYGKT